jgi:bifunctional enzyme CysN/CysC
MDLVGYRNKVFENIVNEFSQFLANIDLRPCSWIPLSGISGDNITNSSQAMRWFRGPTLLEILDVFEKEKPPINKSFRMPVQDVYKFTNFGDSRRIVAGTIQTGSIRVGDEVVFYPSGKKSKIKNIEVFSKPPQYKAAAGDATGFTLDEQIYVSRGEVAARANEARPKVTSRLKVNLFWLGKIPMIKGSDYLLRLGTSKVRVTIEEIHRIIDASSLHSHVSEKIERHEVAECTLKLNKAIAFDLVNDIAATSRFVIVNDNEICGGGIIVEDLADDQAWLRNKLFLRDYKWEKSSISWEQRSEKYNQKAALILVTGEKDSGKKPFAKRLESRLFNEGKLVYFLGIGNVLYGVDADMKGKNNNREEHLRRLAEVAHIMMDAGVLVIVTAIELTQKDLDLIGAIVESDSVRTIWVGENVTTNVPYDLKISITENVEKSVEATKTMLQECGIIFRPC